MIKIINFNYLNNGDLKSIFSKEEYLEYLENSNYLEYDILGELLAIPNVLSEKGIFYFILEKKIKVIKKYLEKNKFIENYYIKCLNSENNYQINENRDCVILIKDGKYYFPIYRTRKNNKLDKNIFLQKIFSKDDKDVSYIINELISYYNKSCISNYIKNLYDNVNLSSKNIIIKLTQNKIKLKNQILDSRNKVKYIQLDNNLYLPTNPSGSDLNYNSIYKKDSELSQIFKLNEVIKILKNIEKILDLDYVPILVYYDNIKKTNPPSYNIIFKLLKNKLIIPIKNEIITNSQLKKFGLSYEFQSLDSKVNEYIDNHDETLNIDYDKRNYRVKNLLYKNEGYNLFRLEVSLYIQNNKKVKDDIKNIINNENIDNINKKNEILNILLKFFDLKINKKSIEKTKKDSLFEIMKEIPDLKNYSISNIRDYCKIYKVKDKCNENLHCTFVNNNCKFKVYNNYIFEYLYRLLEEIVQNSIKYKEIMQEDNYYVSDIVDYTQYSNRPFQKIIKTTNFNIKKILSELFGKDSIPELGKRRINKSSIKVEEDFPELIKFSDQFVQEIISNKNTIIRAYVNSYYWLHNPLYDIETRNLNYYSELQDKITNLFKANIIDYIQNNVYDKDFLKI